ncbi:predicted protein [Histoplasma capsulatum G186AR]|uniref:Uncharacterized protein n=1 Tax=Ajellomyces capsulatus (strain G186AR / H82 / ATCC MYA-2454 / RMSCC 2432) TaxID=447093 RepID=C0ND09_AJECG|nr:uncharacterized protein HCBG_01005 [Histoplasma capsulatum G186AR]EEH11550.1 predicted protein [Histoplasma capsulatum G186AR]
MIDCIYGNDSLQQQIKPRTRVPQKVYIFLNANVVKPANGSILTNQVVKISRSLVEVIPTVSTSTDRLLDAIKVNVQVPASSFKSMHSVKPVGMPICQGPMITLTGISLTPTLVTYLEMASPSWSGYFPMKCASKMLKSSEWLAGDARDRG